MGLTCRPARSARTSIADSVGPVPRYVITGGLGVGKTVTIALLSDRFETVAEPARELIAEHHAGTGEDTIDHRPGLFVERLIARSIEKYLSATEAAVTIFDRGLPDCVAYALALGIDPEPALEVAATYRYATPVFLAPPWEEIYTTDAMRRATFAQAEAFHDHVISTYGRLGYETIELPKASAEERAAFVASTLARGA